MDAFLTACTIFAGQREYAVETTASEVFEALSRGAKDSGKTGPAGR